MHALQKITMFGTMNTRMKRVKQLLKKNIFFKIFAQKLGGGSFTIKIILKRRTNITV